MKNRINKIIAICMISCVLPVFAHADDVVVTDEDVTVTAPAVVERMDCNQIKAKITELSTSEEDGAAEQLAALQNQYRRDCVRRGVVHRPAGRDISVVYYDTVEEDVETDVVLTGDTPVVTDAVAPDASTDVAVVDDAPAGPSEEQIIAWLDAGLCADGQKPNRYGCCAGETFTALDNLTFACCPADKDAECFPPIK